MVKIHFTYRHVDKPWGGANNFIRALHGHLLASGGFRITGAMEDDCDVVFMNQLGTGPGGDGRTVPLRQVRRAVGHRSARRPKLVVRAVNLNRHAFPSGPRNLTLGWWRDRRTVALLNIADVAIFQSAYQRDFFARAGYRGGRHVVIHNGAATDFWAEQPAAPALGDTLRLVSTTASPRASKRHDLIARMSLQSGVEVDHFGAWPEGVDTAKVRRHGVQPAGRIARAMAASHYFLHAAEKDPCPNSVFEAVCTGLPVLYNPAPGSSAEIVGACGLAIDELDVARSVAAARRELATLRTTVLAERHRYAISHAAARYRAVFEQLAGAP